MRDIALGQWTYFAWHLPTLILCGLLAALAASTGVSLWRDALGPREKHLRFSLLGWASVVASVLAVAVWPYLSAFATVHVTRDGTWELRNYLGIPVATVPAAEHRVFEGQDFGGMNLGAGRIRVRRADGSVAESVRIAGARFDRARAALGYASGTLRPVRGSVMTRSHAFGPAGPRFDADLASR